VNFSEQPPSEHWASLKYRGEKFAEVWFKPEGEPCALTFRIPQSSFQIPGMGPLITIENLLKAVAIAAEEVEFWRHGDVCDTATDGSKPELGEPLPPPPNDVDFLSIHVTLKPPPPEDSGAAATALEKEQGLVARWNVIMGVETAIDSLRLRVESAQAEMLAASQRMLAPDKKVHALNADMHLWTKAKGRTRFVLPKAKEFVHRATWVTGG
jgi:hypothetical protein